MHQYNFTSIRGPVCNRTRLIPESGENWSLKHFIVESGTRVAALASQLDLVKTHEDFRKLDFQHVSRESSL